MRRRQWVKCAMVVVLCWPSVASATVYKIDTDHSTVGFTIRHLVSKVRGQFNTFSGELTYVPGEPDKWKVRAVIQADSIDTNVAERDKHLRSADFFDVEQFPTLEFVSTEVADAQDGTAKLHGTLTIHGVERPVIMDLEIHGEAADPWGNQRAGFTGTVVIDRKDFGLTWNQALEAGGVLVSDEVTIELEVEGITL